jgi:hypothetical protein
MFSKRPDSQQMQADRKASTMSRPFRPPLSIAFFSSAALLLGCQPSTPAHPWIDLGPDSPYEMIEFSGADAGQVVIAMPPTVTRDEALELGRRIQSQAPPGATVNVRLYNDEATARDWRTASNEMSTAHLLVTVTTSSAAGEPEVRWVRPDSLDDPAQAVPMTPGMPMAPGTTMPGMPMDSAGGAGPG